MDEQKHLKNEQGEPGNKTEKSEYLFMQETIKDENSRGKKYRKDLLRIAGLGVAFGVCACISFSALRPWLDEKFPGDSQEVVIPEKKRKKSRMKPLQIPAMTVQYRRLALTVTENFRKQ